MLKRWVFSIKVQYESEKNGRRASSCEKEPQREGDIEFLKGVWVLKERGHLQIGVVEGVKVLDGGSMRWYMSYAEITRLPG